MTRRVGRVVVAALALVASALVLMPRVGSQTPSLMFVASSAGAVPWSGSTAGVPNVTLASGTATPATILPTSPAITAGSGTGVTVNNTGEVRQVVYKVTVAAAAFTCAALTCDVTVATLPAKTFVTHALADLTAVFACSATCTTTTLSFTLGKTAGGAEYLVSVDADAATGRFGTTTATLGASLTEATIPTTIGDLASWTTTTAVVMRFTSATGNIGTGAATNLSTGSVTFYLTTEVFP